MRVRFSQLEVQIEQAAGSAAGSSRGVWFGYLASGVTHLAGGLLLGSVWGTSIVQLVPPPHGKNAIDLTARPAVSLEATMVAESDQSTPVTMTAAAPSQGLDADDRQHTTLLRTQASEMPPVALSREIMEPIEPHSHPAREPEPLAGAKAPSRERTEKPRDITGHKPKPALKKAVVGRPPAIPQTAADPAFASVRQQGQDAEAAPQKVYSPVPTYPAAALRDGIAGRVVLRVTIDKEGVVVMASVLTSSGSSILDEAALAGVRKWRFEPARRLGVAVEKEIAVPITFRIAGPPE